jgi:hypothetical protein
MVKDWKEFYDKMKRITGRDPLNLSNLTFIKKNERVEDYANRVLEYRVFRVLKNTFATGPDWIKLLANTKGDYTRRNTVEIRQYLPFIEAVRKSPFYNDNVNVGLIHDISGRFIGCGVHFKEVVVNNYQHNTNHKITDLYFHFAVGGGFRGFRTSFLPVEVANYYQHSHLQTYDHSRAIDPTRGWCLGDGTMRNYHSSHILQNSNSQDYIDAFMFVLQKYVSTESSEGGPYIYFSQLYKSVGSASAPIGPLTSKMKEILKYVTYKYNSGGIKVEVDSKIVDDKEIIQYFGVDGDEFGNSLTSQTRTPEISVNLIGVTIHHKVKYTKPSVVTRRLPSNFITQVKNKLENDINSYTNKKAIFTKFNSTGDSNSSALVEGIAQGDSVHEFQALVC